MNTSNTMKSIFIPLFLFLFGAVQAQSPKATLVELYGAADAVVVAEINSVKGGNFQASVNEIWKGEPGKEVGVAKYRNTKTAKRWIKYATGERVLLFLKKDGNSWEILGENGEGEKLMMMDKVYLDSRGTGVWNRFSYFPVVDDATIYAEEVVPADLKAALIGVAGCYSIGYSEGEDKEGNPIQEVYSTRSCGEEGLDALRSLSDMANELTDQADRMMR